MMTIWDMADACGNVRVSHVAAEAGVGKRVVYKWVDAGLLKYRRLPDGHLRFKAADVEAFLGGMTKRSES
jgi:excisionase family DNA binding protein